MELPPESLGLPNDLVTKSNDFGEAEYRTEWIERTSAPRRQRKGNFYLSASSQPIACSFPSTDPPCIPVIDTQDNAMQPIIHNAAPLRPAVEKC